MVSIDKSGLFAITRCLNKENAIDKIFKKTIHPKMNQNQAFR